MLIIFASNQQPMPVKKFIDKKVAFLSKQMDVIGSKVFQIDLFGKKVIMIRTVELMEVLILDCHPDIWP